MTDVPTAEAWTVVIPRVPSEPSRHRVAVWRELRRSGAIQIGHGAWALPASPVFAATRERILTLIADQGGTALVLRSTADDAGTDERLRADYDEARRAEWTEFASECTKAVDELEREIAKQKLTLAELDEEEQNVERLRRWHRELTARDLFEAVDPATTQAQLDACVAVLEHFTTLVYDAVGVT
jgi:hypothetical protein